MPSIIIPLCVTDRVMPVCLRQARFHVFIICFNRSDLPQAGLLVADKLDFKVGVALAQR